MPRETTAVIPTAAAVPNGLSPAAAAEAASDYALAVVLIR